MGGLVACELVACELVACELVVGELVVCELVACGLVACELVVGELVACELVVGELVVGELVACELVVGELVVGELVVGEKHSVCTLRLSGLRLVHRLQKSTRLDCGTRNIERRKTCIGNGQKVSVRQSESVVNSKHRRHTER